MPNDLSRVRRTAFATSLKRCYLFSELPAQDLQCIASFVVQKRLGKGECLFREGAPFEGFYVVDEGAISVHRVNASGKMQVIHVFRAGESFAEAALAENTGYPADALALEQTSVLLVPKVPFLELLQKHSELALRMLGSMSRPVLIKERFSDVTTRDGTHPNGRFSPWSNNGSLSGMSSGYWRRREFHALRLRCPLLLTSFTLLISAMCSI